MSISRALDIGYMKQALEEAARAAGLTRPNPMVGCVLVSNQGQILAKGYHKRAGQPHAERRALAQVLDKNALVGATAYVTLEPCAHFGRTPPCADALIEAQIGRVVIALADPHGIASGGAEKLRQAGIQVEFLNECEEDSADVARVFITNVTEERAHLALKVATSLDGHMYLNDYESQWITGAESRRKVHQLRDYYQATCVSAKTLLLDNASLNIREVTASELGQMVIVLDPSARLLSCDLEQLNLFKRHVAQRIIILTSDQHLNKLQSKLGSKAQVHQWNFTLGWMAFSQYVYRNLKCVSLMIEAGPSLASQIIESKGWDDLLYFQAPFIMGKNGYSISQAVNLQSLSDKALLKRKEIEVLGVDVFQRFSSRCQH